MMNETAQAAANPALGILIFTLGGLAGAAFTLPFKKVKRWAWESYWMVYALFGLVIVPWALAFAFSPNVPAVLKAAPGASLAYCFGCGAAWGVGGLTWGLMIRYLGVGLGLAIGCGLCSAAGTLIPPILNGNLKVLTGTPSADATRISVGVSLAGIIAVGLAGRSKERELSEEAKKKAVAEFNFRKGLSVAVFSGLMSSAMSFGLQGGAAIERLSQTTAPFTSPTWKGLPVLVVVLAGGFTVNFLWCLFLNVKNKTFGDYVKPKAPLAGNLIFAGFAGAIWCSQFICFKTGEPVMGQTAYVGWAVLMASTILFSSLLGILLGEWKGTSRRTRSLLAAGLVLLILSSVLAGYSGYLSQAGPAQIMAK
jgi:L-rhamnose-H+ transport protein